jgi:mono/diheme cytochrome c family protein
MALDAVKSTADLASIRAGEPGHGSPAWPSRLTEDDMKTPIAVAVAIMSIAAAGISVAQDGGGMGRDPQGTGMGMGPQGMGMMARSPVRHHFVMQHGIDPKYADETDPLAATANNLSRGRQIYEQTCAACHGPQGFGDGPAGKSLQPPPARLVGLSRMPMATDGYLYWTVAEGGIPVGSAMPPYKDTLKPEDIWQVILFLQTL